MQTNHYVYRTVNKINGMKYIGKRTCHCDIKDDPYLGSGKLFEEDVKKYGTHNFEKEILFICESEEKCLDKEKEIIHVLDAANSMEYYNIAPGGPSRPRGFRMSQKEKEKFEMLKNKMKNEPIYGVKVERQEIKPRIVLALIENLEDGKQGSFFTIDNDCDQIVNDSSITGKLNIRITIRHMNGNYLIDWLHDSNYMLISESDYNRYRLTDRPSVFNEFVNEIKMQHKKYFDDMNRAKISKTEAVSKVHIDTPENTIQKQLVTNMDYIREYAKTSRDYANFLSLLEKYEDLGLIVVHNAITGLCSITAKCIKDGKLKCSDKQYNAAINLLNYESKFKKIAKKIGGRQDYFYMTIALCYKRNDVDNDELYRKICNKYKNIDSMTSIRQVIEQIDRIYNNRRTQKIYIYQDYLRERKK